MTKFNQLDRLHGAIISSDQEDHVNVAPLIGLFKRSCGGQAPVCMDLSRYDECVWVFWNLKGWKSLRLCALLRIKLEQRW